jgi:hypothetical protein
MSDVGNEPVDEERALGQGEIHSLKFLANEYDFTAPDLFVGADSSQYLLDYGQPLILADSRGGDPYRIRIERELWEQLPGEAAAPSRKPWFRRLGGRWSDAS